jgi:hypothetical protein
LLSWAFGPLRSLSLLHRQRTFLSSSVSLVSFALPSSYEEEVPWTSGILGRSCAASPFPGRRPV